MKPRLPLLALSVLLLSACGPTLTPAPSPAGRGESALTSTPTRTPTPAPTSTPSATPTPSLPPEALTRLAGRGWRIEGDKVMVGDVAWYTQDAEGQWQPAQFVADFDSYQFSLEGLEIADEDGVVRIYDPNASDEAARLVYEDGKFSLRFAVENLTDLMPTPYPPEDDPYYGAKLPSWDVFSNYLPTLASRMEAVLEEKYGVEFSSSQKAVMIINNTEELFTVEGILLDPEIFAYGFVLITNPFGPHSAVWLYTENADGDIIVIPLFETISREDIFSFWNEPEN